MTIPTLTSGQVSIKLRTFLRRLLNRVFFLPPILKWGSYIWLEPFFFVNDLTVLRAMTIAGTLL